MIQYLKKNPRDLGMLVVGVLLIGTGQLLVSCAADGTIASKSKPLDKEATRLAVCEGAQKIDIAFQTIAAGSPGLIPVNVVEAEKAVIDTVGFATGSPAPARPGSVCAKQYSGDLDVAINTGIIAVTNISELIKKWQRG